MTDKPSWQAAGFHSPNKQWRQSCRIKARIGQNFRGETVDATRRESADAKKCRMGMTPNDFLFKIRPCFQRPARALFGTDHVDVALALVAAQAAHGADLPQAGVGHSSIRSPFQALEEQMAVQEWEAQQRAEAESRAWIWSAFGPQVSARRIKEVGR
jgi:hypothetical protein